jgi:hypothetical protein
MFRLTSVIAAAAIVLGMGCASDDTARPVGGDAALPPATAVLTSTQAPAPVAASPTRTAFPSTFVAVREWTRLAVVDTVTGEDQRVLFDLGPQGQTGDGDLPPSKAINGLALSPDGTTAYFSVSSGPGPDVLYRVRLDGTPAEQIGSGSQPAVSPDGHRLAYLERHTVVVQDLATGAVTRYPSDDDLMIEPWVLAWAADSRHLVFAAQDTESFATLRVLDTSTPGTLAGSRRLAVGTDGELWLTGVRVSDGLVGAIVAPLLPESDVAEPGRVFVLLDPVTGAEKGRLDLPFAAAQAAYDATGLHQLFLDQDGTVHRHSDGRFTRIPGAGAVRLVW